MAMSLGEQVPRVGRVSIDGAIVLAFPSQGWEVSGWPRDVQQHVSVAKADAMLRWGVVESEKKFF